MDPDVKACVDRAVDTGEVPFDAALAQIVERCVPAHLRMDVQQVLGRLRKYVVAGETLIYAATAETLSGRGCSTKPLWLLVTDANLYICPRRTGAPQAYATGSAYLTGTAGGVGIVLPGAATHNGFRIPQLFLHTLNGEKSEQHWIEKTQTLRWTGPGKRFQNALDAAPHVLNARRARAQSGATAGSRGKPTRDGARPAPRLIRTPRDAELVVAEWMKFFGFSDARPTPVGKDEGIDVTSKAAVAQVKMEGILTSRPVVQALFGVATAEEKKGLFFSLGGYTPDALSWGSKVGIAMFTFDLQGEPVPANAPAKNLHKA